MSKKNQKGWLRNLVEFALDEDVNEEVKLQQQIIKQNPRSAKAHFDLGILYYSKRQIKESISEFEAAIECDHSFASAYRKLGEVYVNTGDYERARQYAVMAAELGDPVLLDMFERYKSA